MTRHMMTRFLAVLTTTAVASCIYIQAPPEDDEGDDGPPATGSTEPGSGTTGDLGMEGTATGASTTEGTSGTTTGSTSGATTDDGGTFVDSETGEEGTTSTSDFGSGSTTGDEGLECAPIGMPLNHFQGNQSTSPNPEPCDVTVCELNPDGSITFSFCLDCPVAGPPPWATCTVGTAHDMSRFDPDSGGAGFMAVTLDVESADGTGTELDGELLLWYGEHPWRKYLVLHDSVGGPGFLPVGSWTKYVASSDACYGGFSEIPASCRYACDEIPDPACEHDFGSSSLMLSAENCQPGGHYEGTITVQDLHFFQPECACIDDADCEYGISECHYAELENLECWAGGMAENPYCGGVCVEP